MQSTIPIIILNWNGLSDTLECMEALEQQTYSNWLAYLVDNGSSGNDAQVLQEKFGQHPKVKLVLNTENLGFTRGNNAVLRQLIQPENDYPYIALLNNDTKVSPQWLQELINAARQENAAIVSSKMINYFNPKQMDNAGHRMLNTGEILPVGHAELIEKHNKIVENMGACAGAALYSVPMLRKIGIFDEYFKTGYEDAEIGMRAFVTGHRAIFAPKAEILHKVSQSINKIRDYEYTLKIQMDIFYTYLKLFPLPVLLINFIPFVFKIGAVLLIDVVFGRWKFLRVMLDALYRTAVTDRKMILTERKKFMQQHQLISSWKILKKQEFFLWFDIKRFKKHIIDGEQMVFEKYKN